MDTEWTLQRILRLALPLIAVLVIIVLALGALGGDDDDDTATTASGSETADDSSSSDAAETEEDAGASVPADDAADETSAGDETDDETVDATQEPEEETGGANTEEQAEEEAEGDPFFEIDSGCAITLHTPIDENSFSHIVWKYEAPRIEDGTQITLSLSDGSEVMTPVVDGVVSWEQGITQYGDYLFPSLAWDDGNNAIFVDGFHTVDEREGLPSETCV